MWSSDLKNQNWLGVGPVLHTKTSKEVTHHVTLGKPLPHSGPRAPHIYSELMRLDDLYCPSSLISHDCLCLKRPLAEEADTGELMVSIEPQAQKQGEVFFVCTMPEAEARCSPIRSQHLLYLERHLVHLMPTVYRRCPHSITQEHSRTAPGGQGRFAVPMNSVQRPP